MSDSTGHTSKEPAFFQNDRAVPAASAAAGVALIPGFDRLLDAIPHIVWTATLDGTFTNVNCRWYEYSGSFEQLTLNVAFRKALHPEEHDRVLAAWQAGVVSGQPFRVEHRLQRHDGVYQHFITDAAPWRNAAGAVQQWIGTSVQLPDRVITDDSLATAPAHQCLLDLAASNRQIVDLQQQQAAAGAAHLQLSEQSHAAVRESEVRFQMMADSAPVLLWVADTDAGCSFVNQEWLAFTGRTMAQEMGEGWLETVHPDDRAHWCDRYLAAFHARIPFEQEYRRRRADGEYRWILDRAAPRVALDGGFVGYIGSCLDITERKQDQEALTNRANELARMTGILAQTATILETRNQELDQFAYVVSHDLKAPLRAIANLSQWLEEDLSEHLTPETHHQMNLLRGRVHRLENLINGLLQYSRIGRITVEAGPIALNALLQEVIDSLAPPPGFTFTIQPDMPTLHTERLRLEQVFANLISNAIKHHDRTDGHITITAQDQGTRYEFAVTDDGPGIDPAFHQKVFGIFQTLTARDRVENTGIGLSLVKKIVESKGGSIQLTSAVGQGATFRFTWPKTL